MLRSYCGLGFVRRYLLLIVAPSVLLSGFLLLFRTDKPASPASDQLADQVSSRTFHLQVQVLRFSFSRIQRFTIEALWWPQNFGVVGAADLEDRLHGSYVLDFAAAMKNQKVSRGLCIVGRAFALSAFLTAATQHQDTCRSINDWFSIGFSIDSHFLCAIEFVTWIGATFTSNHECIWLQYQFHSCPFNSTTRYWTSINTTFFRTDSMFWYYFRSSGVSFTTQRSVFTLPEWLLSHVVTLQVRLFCFWWEPYTSPHASCFVH